MQRTLPIVFLAALAAPTAWAGNDAAKEFQRNYVEKPNSWERIELIKSLDPSDKDQLDLLTDFVLARGEWFYREAAIDVLAGVHDEDVIKRLERLSKKEIVAEAVCLAFGKSGSKDRIPFLVEQLDNKKWKVKRAAAIALGQIPDKRGVEALISAWENEDMFMVWVHILESLERVTREKNLDTPEKWRGWWDAVKANWEPPTGEVDEESLGGGEINKTKVRGTNLDYRSRGKGLPLLVLPEYGYEKDYLETYLRELEDNNLILYMALPGANDFTDPPLKPEVAGLPYYPIDRIVEAFEGLHEQLVKDGKIEDKPFALMAHGMTCWIAMKFAEKHPRLVRKMILISPVSGNKAWGDGRDRTEAEGNKRGDIEMEHYAQSQLIENGAPRYKAADEREEYALQRKGHTLMFADHRDLEIGRILGPISEKIVDTPQGKARSVNFKAFRPMGGVLIPEFSLFKLNRTRTPTLIFYGPNSLRTSGDDCAAIQKHYGTAGVVTFKRSSRMPFIEENEEFVEKVNKFLGGKRRS
ncbi:MAG: hypothetical protein R3F62_21245 [Planctomycetota bacterium]